MTKHNWKVVQETGVETLKGIIQCDNSKQAALIAAAPELLEIAKAYRNLLKTMAHTDGEVATFHHIESIISKAEGN